MVLLPLLTAPSALPVSSMAKVPASSVLKVTSGVLSLLGVLRHLRQVERRYQRWRWWYLLLWWYCLRYRSRW